MTTTLKWTKEIPTLQGWYWVKWSKSERSEGQVGMWFFDAGEYDLHQLKTRAELFYGPLVPPSEDNGDC